jgi:hypothetical protein
MNWDSPNYVLVGSNNYWYGFYKTKEEAVSNITSLLATIPHYEIPEEFIVYESKEVYRKEI